MSNLRGPGSRAVAAVLLLLTATVTLPNPARAASPCDPLTFHAVACENTKPGSLPSMWNVAGAGSANIQGFATDMSVNLGQTISFKIKTTATRYRLDIYRFGYYQGRGARKIATRRPFVSLPQQQPRCRHQPATGLIDCGNWSVSARWFADPAIAVSGVYAAKLVREDGTPGASHIFFVVRDDTGRSDLLFQTSDSTWQAYNRSGGGIEDGNSLYQGMSGPGLKGRAFQVSYNRPLDTRLSSPGSAFFNAEYPMVRWLEQNGYDVSYTSNVDTQRRGWELLEHEAFLSVGHDEYWSRGQRQSVEAARDRGVALAFFSGNEVYWKTRWLPSIDGSRTPFRTLVCYKEPAASDPSPTWTGLWRDHRTTDATPENALIGSLFTVNIDERYDAIRVPSQFGRHRFWRNTSVAALRPGEVATMPAGTLGFEWGEVVDNGFTPAGVEKLSQTTVAGVSRLVAPTYMQWRSSQTATHNLTLYRHSSGALVFGASSVQWSWGLDSNHDRNLVATPPDVRMRQATVNLLADMNAHPTTLQPGLVPG